MTQYQLALANFLSSATLVLVTMVYVVLTGKLATSAKESAKFAQEASAAAQAGLSIDFELVPVIAEVNLNVVLSSIVLVNAGNASLYLRGVLVSSAMRIDASSRNDPDSYETTDLNVWLQTSSSGAFLHPGESISLEAGLQVPFHVNLVAGRVTYSLSPEGDCRTRVVSEISSVSRYTASRSGPMDGLGEFRH